MPTNDTNNNQDTNGLGQTDTQDIEAGDVLEQLKAESATSANLYKLELKLFNTVKSIDKTMTKEYKLFIQGRKSLDHIDSTLASIKSDTRNLATAMSSVDSGLRRILEALGHIRDDGIASGNGNSNGSGNNSNTSNSNASVLEDRLKQERRELERLRRQYDNNEIDDAEFAANAEPVIQSIDHLEHQLNIIYEALANHSRIYENYQTAEELAKQQRRDLIDSFATGEITEQQLKDSLDALREATESHSDVLRDAEAAWKGDSKFSFAKEAKNLKAGIEQDFDARKADLIDRFNRQVPDENGNVMDNDMFTEAMNNLMGERSTAMANVTGALGVQGIDNIAKVGGILDNFINQFSSGNTYNAKTGENHTAAAATEAAGAIGGTLVGAEVGAAIGTAIGGPVGTVVGGIIGDLVGSKIEALTGLIADRLDYLANHSKKTRDEILKAGFDKISQDVKAMATYSIEIYETSTKNIYAAWDKNLSQITATQGYTKEALNSLQDSVAQRLKAEGYGATIDASKYLDQLANTLNANLGGQLAEAFSAQNLILQKAIPEVDLSQSAAQFAAIYAQANKQGGNGEDTMIAAMNEIAGAAKALEDVTEGNNQFLKQTGTLLTKATEVVNIAGGNADQIADLTTQMMASEAAITSVAPQLSGFTNELISVLMNNNDATAVSLRAIMNDINSDIGVSATSFMQSFMSDTQGTLSTAFAAIQKFIDQNENEASRQEFLHAMESVFGVQGSKLAQIDFGSVSDLISKVNTSTNMAALTKAENLVRAGETTSLEEQLVANTTNQLLATNAISATLDNKLMRQLEQNELSMERIVYSVQATQSVELAQNTLDFFTKITDLIMSIIDPFGLFDMFTTKINAATSTAIDAERYAVTAAMSNVGSTVASSVAGAQNSFANTIGGATAVIAASQTKSTDAMVFAVENSGVAPTFEHMMLDYAAASKAAQAAIANNQAESNVISYASMEQQAKSSSEYQQKQQDAMDQDRQYEEEKKAQQELQQQRAEEERLWEEENHGNIVIIKDALDDYNNSLRENYLSPILDEHKTHTDQLNDLKKQTAELVNLVSTIIEWSMVQSPEFASTISPDERTRIMDNGYVTSSFGGFF